MGRPALPLGHHGEVRVYAKGNAFQARTKVRDFDGKTRQVARAGKSPTAAKKALQTALKARHVATYGSVTPDMKVSQVVELYWAEWLNTNPSPGSKTVYRDRIDKQILPEVGSLYVRELTTLICDKLIQGVAANNGPGLARTTRAVLSGICGFATKHDALPRNPVADVGRIRAGKRRKDPRALTLDEARDLQEKYRVNQQAIDWDLPDLLDFMLSTGVRISEALAVEWDDLNIEDENNGTVRVGDAIVVRERGVGLYIRREASSKLKERELELPSWMVAVLRDRRTRTNSNLVFQSPRGNLRDPNNTRADFRATLTAVGYEWATSHTFRRTVASLMEESGLGARAAADQLGHSKITMTQDHYFGRSRKPKGAKSVLELVHNTTNEVA